MFLFTALLFSLTKSIDYPGAIPQALTTAVNCGANRTDLVEFIGDAYNFANRSSLPNELNRIALLASNIIELNPNPIAKYPAYIDTKFVIILKAILQDPDFWAKFVVDVLFPTNGFNSTGAQQLIDELIEENTPSMYNLSNAREALDYVLTRINANQVIIDTVDFAIDNSETITTDPDTYFKTILQTLIDEFRLPEEVEEFANFVIKDVPIVNNTDDLYQVIKAFIGSDYIPDRLNDELQILVDDWENYQNFSATLGAALGWELIGPEIKKQVPDVFMDEFDWVDNLLTNYIFKNFTLWLYFLDDIDYSLNTVLDEVSAFINSTDIRDGWKDLYTIVLELPRPGANVTVVIEELFDFFNTTDIFTQELKDVVDTLFDLIEGTSSESKLFDKFRIYVDSIGLSNPAQQYYQEIFVDGNITAFSELSNYTESLEDIQKLAIIVISIMDADKTTFGTLDGPFFPNNLIVNLNRIAMNLEYIDNDLILFTTAVFESITDMYPFDYPIPNFLNATAQILPIIIENITYIENNTESFVQDVLLILENTFILTLNARDLVEIAQIYLDLNTLADSSFNGVLDFMCEPAQTMKDIGNTLCTALTLVNDTITFIDNTKNITVEGVIDAVDWIEILPFLSDFVDAIVGTLDATLGSRLAAALDGAYQYLIPPDYVSGTRIANLVNPIGLLYLSNTTDETIYMCTMDFVDEVLKVIYPLTDTPTQAPTPTPTPTSNVVIKNGSNIINITHNILFVFGIILLLLV